MGKGKVIKRLALGLAALIFIMANTMSCGRDLEHKSRPADIRVGDGSLSLATSKSQVRADGDDRIELSATVRGLTSVVRFEIIDGPGSLQAESAATTGGAGTLTDGVIVDAKADRLGVARVNYRSEFAGTAKVVAKSLHVQTQVNIDAKFATLIIVPGQSGSIASGPSPVQNLTSTSSTVFITPGGDVGLTAIGGVPPYTWWSSTPDLIGVNIASENSVIAFVQDGVTAGTGSVIVSVLDAEGNFASVSVEISSDTFFSTLTVTPSSLSFTSSGGTGLDTETPIVISGGAPPYVVRILSPFGFSGVGLTSPVSTGTTSVVVKKKEAVTGQYVFLYRVVIPSTGSLDETITVTDSVGTTASTTVTATAS